ncbi:MAG: 3-dehydroquinate synthase [Coriobacteriales bacterium]|nr:3-dehydroquinate synthase [Coriobacteriales bacterium]
MSNIIKLGFGMVETALSYNAHVGRGALSNFADEIKSLKPKAKILIICDKKVEPIYGEIVQNKLEDADFLVETYSFKEGEYSKCLDVIDDIWTNLSQRGYNRGDLIVAVGGGVVSDIACFVSATYMRGIDFAIVPTTLLSMVDACIGGKGAINMPQGKNLIGVFHQPIYVCADTRCLNTLAPAQIQNGYAELIKTSLIAKRRSFFEWLRDNAQSILDSDEVALTNAIKLSMEEKGRLVSFDPYDNQGVREILNFGHTFAHALEAIYLSKKSQIDHGLAVAEGIRFASRLSVQVCGLDIEVVKQIDKLLDRFNIGQIQDKLEEEAIYNFMKIDKKSKNLDSMIHFVLLRDIGNPLACNVDEDVLREHISAFCRSRA